MPEPDAQIGVTIYNNKLYYAICVPDEPGRVRKIGQVTFSFDLLEAITSRDPETFPGLCETLGKLIREEGVSRLGIAYPPNLECWSIVPKSVFDIESERAAHLNILMQGTNENSMITDWHPLSNNHFKLLSVRNRDHLDSFSFLLNGLQNTRLYSDFEIGKQWVAHSDKHGSFLSISSGKGVVGISSYLLGSLRAATYITCEDITDLPYLWLQQAAHLPWMHGMHEHILLYGDKTDDVREKLQPWWDDSSEIVVMDSLDVMNVTSDEESYSFPLERAFPAILVSLS